MDALDEARLPRAACREAKALLPSLRSRRARKTFWESYRVGDLLGVGSFSKVFACEEITTGKEYAVKVIALENGGDTESAHEESTSLRETKQELEVLMAVRQARGTIQLRDFFQHFEPECNGTVIFIVMDLMKGEDLDELLSARGSFAEEDAKDIMRQVFSACKELHRRRVVHRDIKLENVMLSEPHVYDRGVKLVDFGLSVCLGGNREQLGRCGTPYSIAPEVLLRKPYGCEVDVWGCGVMMYALLCGFPPFFSNSMTTLFRRISKRSLSFKDPSWSLVSESAKDLIERCLTLDPDIRITAEDALNHPWLRGQTALPKLQPAVRRTMRHFSL